MNPSYPLQRHLFERIEQRFTHKNAWLRQYMERSGLSPSPAYSRFRGEKPISFDEGLALLAGRPYMLKTSEKFSIELFNRRSLRLRRDKRLVRNW